MKKLIILSFIFLFISCINIKKDVETPSCNYSQIFNGIEICLKEGDHNYFLKMIDNDSLFINVICNDSYVSSYIYYTKGSIKSLSWETGGKHSKHITNIQK